MPEENKVSKAQQKAVNKYVKNNYDRINVTFLKAKRNYHASSRSLRGIRKRLYQKSS